MEPWTRRRGVCRCPAPSSGFPVVSQPLPPPLRRKLSLTLSRDVPGRAGASGCSQQPQASGLVSPQSATRRWGGHLQERGAAHSFLPVQTRPSSPRCAGPLYPLSESQLSSAIAPPGLGGLQTQAGAAAVTRPGSSAPAPPLGEERESPTGQPSAPGASRPWRCAPWVAAGMPRPSQSGCERAEPRGPLGPAARRAPPEPGAVPWAVWKGAGERGGKRCGGRGRSGGAQGCGQRRPSARVSPGHSAGDAERARSTNLLEAAVPPRPTRAPGTEALASLSLPSSSLLRRDAPSCRA